ncbi:MAG: PD40 domain-containing protein [Chloroflexi bacterium]|nr:PD40 domain-containing protein [Chloroflexota bacterium]
MLEVRTGRLWRLALAPTVWAPDGTALLQAGCCIGEGGIDLIDIEAGTAVRILGGDVAAASWSPDGSQIAFSKEMLGPKGVYVIDRDGSNLRQLSELGTRAIHWSPQGDLIALSHRKVYLIEIPSGETSAIFGRSNGVAWSPDGRLLAITNKRGLYLFDVASGGLRQIASGPSRAPITWSPDGTKIAFIFGPPVVPSAVNPADKFWLFHTVEIHGSAEPRPLPPARILSWSPDGSRLAYQSEGCSTRDWNIYVLGADGASAKPLTKSPDSPKEGPYWSPAGYGIAFSTFDKVVLVNADTGKRRTLVVSKVDLHIHGYEGSPWSSDGRSLIVLADFAHGICD